MNTKTPECWANDQQAHALRVEISPERSVLLPFDQFVFAELKYEGKRQQLRLVFVTHEVFVKGHALRRIELALQQRELSNLAALTGNQGALVPEGQPFVNEIKIVEVNASENPSDKILKD
jgi:hypothetical protein